MLSLKKKKTFHKKKRIIVISINLIFVLILLFFTVSGLVDHSTGKPIINDSVTGTTTTEDSNGFEEYVWYNGEKEEQVFVALDQVGIYPENGSEKSNVDEVVRSYGKEAALVGNYEYLILIGLPDKLNITTLEEKNNEFQRMTGNRAFPVFYQAPKKDSAPMVLTGEIIVHFKPDWDEARITQWARDMGIEIREKFSFSANTYLFNAGTGMRSLKLANQIYLSGQTMYAYPNWWKAMELKNSDKSTSIPAKSETTQSENPKEIPFISNTTAILLALLFICIMKYNLILRIYK